jgi:protein gp37
VHDGCKFCYAEVNYSVKMRGVKWGPNGTRVKLSESGWREPLKWNREAEKAGERRRVFCASLADVFEDWQGPVLDHRGVQLYKFSTGETLASDQFDVGNIGERPLTLDDLRRDLFKLIDATPMLDWLLLTKRPENIGRMWPSRTSASENWFFDPADQKARGLTHAGPHKSTVTIGGRVRRKNVWLGTSVSDQATADEWIPGLLECRDLSPVLFVSAEPLLGPIVMRPEWLNVIRWLIVGGESGAGARAHNVQWDRALIVQCRKANVAYFEKQLGSNPFEHVAEDMAKRMFPNGVPAGASVAGSYEHYRDFHLEHSKGGDPAEWPQDLNVRQFPIIPAAV